MGDIDAGVLRIVNFNAHYFHVSARSRLFRYFTNGDLDDGRPWRGHNDVQWAPGLAAGPFSGGAIDDLRMYDRVLSASEIEALVNSQPAADATPTAGTQP
jgi:hypothetical protein